MSAGLQVVKHGGGAGVSLRRGWRTSALDDGADAIHVPTDGVDIGVVLGVVVAAGLVAEEHLVEYPPKGVDVRRLVDHSVGRHVARGAHGAAGPSVGGQ